MNQNNQQDLFDQTKLWLIEAGTLIRERMTEPLLVSMKSNKNDLVTEIDKSVEEFFIQKITKNYPNDRILSEEHFGDTELNEHGITWIIDPIDGTMNLVHQQDNFAISIGIYDAGIGKIGFIYDVMNDQLYSAVKGQGAFKNDRQLQQLDSQLTLDKSLLCVNPSWICHQKHFSEKGLNKIINSVHGIRYYGAATLQIALVAEGKIGTYLSLSIEPWDYAAGKIILEEVGGIMTKIDGSPINSIKKESCVVCHPQIHKQVVDELNHHI